jgi:hypothetical protein
LIANSIEQNINHDIEYTFKQKIIMIAASFLYVLTIAIGSVLGGDYQLVSSGKFSYYWICNSDHIFVGVWTFCDMNKPAAIVLICFFAILIPRMFINYKVFQLY